MAVKKDKELVRCIDCKYAVLTQRFSNPVIAGCPYIRVPGLHYVAECGRYCESYAKRNSKPLITHFNSY